MNKNWTVRLALVFFIVFLGLAYQLGNLDSYFTLKTLQQYHMRLIELYDRTPIQVITLFSLLYIFAIALSIPISTLLTLASGALFGLTVGTIVISISSSIGASLAFLISRYLLRDWIQTKFSNRLRRINHGIKKDGAYYLATIRLIPIFPFFLVNLLMGVTPLRLSTYFWVSLITMLPGHLVYVNAGTYLPQISSVSEILSLKILLSLLLIGLLPLISKLIVSTIKKTHPMEIPE